ncbi:zinc finger CCCH domain-containing protein 45 [Podospora fimiseda]|uniref:Zinc finger CCCH domain-containing protein 45 n=1 Tax=Podospora fimiseda TaxID=252190 RepID=A0AAN7GXQ8_9PEZI|nr:zinc finger CCCH domain-containing protein 45 [Podospora fimiseda]
MASSHTSYPSPYSHQQPVESQQTQLDMSPQHRSLGAFDMNGLTNALPPLLQQQQHPGQRVPPYNQSPQRYNIVTMPTPGTAAQPPVSHLAPAPNHQYYLAQQAHMAQFYPPTPSPQQPSTNVPPRPDINFYAGAPVIVNQQHHPGAHCFYQTPAFPGQGPHGQAQLHLVGQYPQPPSQHQAQDRQHQDQQTHTTHPVLPGNLFSPESRQTNVVRGPPRKPRQSGHAIWIGNLPPQTSLMDLVHHVCRETNGLESLFLISKSSCAFANFKDEESSITAQRKLHDSKFMMVKLVSRLRKNTVEGPAGVTVPTGPASTILHKGPASNQGNAIDVNEDHGSAVAEEAAPAPAETPAFRSPEINNAIAQKDRFFVLKSLTIEDLDLSVKTGIWATQSHNEQTLNDAFKNSENIYLVFSANKSGEYYGYARMISSINDDPAAAIKFAPKMQSTADVDVPRAIPTIATKYVPKGRIIDDSARGTIFWEADRGDQTQDGVQDEDGPADEGDTGSADGENKAWGKPFQLEWLSTNRLPFYRTRGLRNPWNSNREVKIARDGTELEPSVGRKLIGLFNKVQSPASAVQGLLPMHIMSVGGGPRIPVPAVTMAGFVPMRPA